MLGLVREISRERGMTFVCNLHQPELAAAFADRLIGHLSRRAGMNVCASNTQNIFARTLAERAGSTT